MSNSGSLHLFPSHPTNRLSEENIRKITEQALETVQARNQSSRQVCANPKTPELQSAELALSPPKSKSPVRRARTARILESPMDRHYATSLVSAAPEVRRSSPTSTVSPPPRQPHSRKLSRVDSIKSASSIYSNDEPKNTSRFSSPLTRTNSPAFSEASTALNTSPSSCNDSPVHLKSMFQTYDPRLPLTQQSFAPSKMPKIEESPSRSHSRLQRKRVDVYSTSDDIHTLWNMANGQKVERSPRPYRLQMHHRASLDNSSESSKRRSSAKNQPLLSFGLTAETPFISVFTSSDSPNVKSHVEIRRHNPDLKGPSIPVADFCLPKTSQSFSTRSSEANAKIDDVTTSFTPKLATLLALESVNELRKAESTNSTAYENALVASKLTTQALESAERKHSSIILHEPLSGDYLLCHSSFGLLPLQVSGPIRMPMSASVTPESESRDSKASSSNLASDPATTSTGILNDDPPIKKHFTSPETMSLLDGESVVGSGTVTLWASSDTSSVQRRAVASLNFRNSTLTLHPAAMEALTDLFVVDTVVCALVAVALAEVRRGVAAIPTPPPIFPAPPTYALSGEKSKSRALSKGKWSLEIRNSEGDLIGDEPTTDLPMVTRGIVKGVNVAAHTVTVLVGVAAKLTTGTVVRASRAYSKA